MGQGERLRGRSTRKSWCSRGAIRNPTEHNVGKEYGKTVRVNRGIDLYY